jgi:phosphate transport system substrate-binding protein
MKKIVFLVFGSIAVISFCFLNSCKKNQKHTKETQSKEKVTIYVDETVASIVEDEVQIYEMNHNVKITLVAKPESEIINIMNRENSGLAVLTRKLKPSEEVFFSNKKISPKVTPFAIDGITLIVNAAYKDSVITISQIKNLLQGKSSTIKGLVFDNPNSSIVKYMDSLAGEKISNNKNVFSMKSHTEVLDYIANNPNMIGVLGLNYIEQPNVVMKQYESKFKVLGVENVKISNLENKYYTPNQYNIAKGLYPFSRKIYLLNYQGKVGLGMQFAVFLANDIGQRIVSRSGLCPTTIPITTVSVRKKIMKD